MRTTLDVDEKLLKDVLALTGEKSKGKALNSALREFVRRKRIEEMKALAGSIDLVDNLKELEELELRELEKLQW